LPNNRLLKILRDFSVVCLNSPKALREGGWLEPHALIVIEEAAEADVALPEGFVLREARRFGDRQLIFCQRAIRRQRHDERKV